MTLGHYLYANNLIASTSLSYTCVEPVTSIPKIVRAPVFPGDDALLMTPVKRQTKASESTKALKESMLTPSLTKRKINYTPVKHDLTEQSSKAKGKKKKKKKKRKYDDDSDDEVSSTTSEVPLGHDQMNPVDSIDLTQSPVNNR